jgi:hypothetical protein
MEDRFTEAVEAMEIGEQNVLPSSDLISDRLVVEYDF